MRNPAVSLLIESQQVRLKNWELFIIKAPAGKRIIEK
jgi:hypothetical protein